MFLRFFIYCFELLLIKVVFKLYCLEILLKSEIIDLFFEIM